jgi:hypothetical protein
MMSRIIAVACVGAFASSGIAQTAADYQVAIREAALAYRGDCVEPDVVVYSGWFDPVSGMHAPSRITNVFFSPLFTLLLTFDQPHNPGSMSLSHPTSNQTLELTATRRMLKLSDDYIALSELDARFRQP